MSTEFGSWFDSSAATGEGPESQFRHRLGPSLVVLTVNQHKSRHGPASHLNQIDMIRVPAITLNCPKRPTVLRDRPSQLLKIPNYRCFPRAEVGLRLDRLPPLLNMDIEFELRGALPLTAAISTLSPTGISVNPNKDVIDYYLSRGTRFQLVSIIMNCAYFELTDEGSYAGIPYSLRLLPATKRGTIDYQDAHILSVIDLEALPFQDDVYTGFNPFDGTWEMYGPYGLFAEKPDIPHFTDNIGFVIGQYLLATDTSPDEALMIGKVSSDPELHKRFHRFRSKRYYTPFTDTRPRAIWGSESPIELYLFQALLHRGLRPIPQVRIYRDGSIYASFHDMFRDDTFKNDTELATTPDLYFPEERVAVYCDSVSYHRGANAKQKDAEVSDRVRALGIKPLRISGRKIVHDLDAAVSDVLTHI